MQCNFDCFNTGLSSITTSITSLPSLHRWPNVAHALETPLVSERRALQNTRQSLVSETQKQQKEHFVVNRVASASIRNVSIHCKDLHIFRFASSLLTLDKEEEGLLGPAFGQGGPTLGPSQHARACAWPLTRAPRPWGVPLNCHLLPTCRR